MARQYTLPQVVVQQDFALITAAATQDLLPVIIGPQKKLRTLDNADDANYVSYGDYIYNSGSNGQDFLIKGLDATDELYADDVHVTLKNVLAKYSTVTGNSNITVGPTLNKIQLNTGVAGGFAAVGSLPRASEFGNRDVRVGDRLAVNYGGSVLSTRVLEIINEIIPSSAGAGGDKLFGNEQTNAQTVAPEAAIISGLAETSVDGFTAELHNTSAFVGDLAAGYLEDTYTVTITTGGAGGTAKARVTSLKNDNVPEITIAASGSATTVGTKGLKINFSHASPAGKVHTAGDTFTFTIKAEWTRLVPAVTSGSAEDFLGTVATTYEVRVIKGGTWAQNPRVLVMTNNGTDSYAAQTVSSNSATFNLGNLGLLASFAGSGDGLRLGDIYTIAVAPASLGAARTIRMADTLPADTASLTAVDFFILKPSVEVAASGYPQYGDEAWAVSEDKRSINIKAGIETLDESWVDGVGEQVPLPVVSGDIYVTYSALVKSNSGVLQSFSTLSSVNAILGEIVPENPLAYGVYKALMNSAGHTVYAAAIETDDVLGYATALESTEGEAKGYYMVPMTKDETIINLFKSHVIALSDPEKSMERIAIVNKEFNPIADIYYKKPNADERWSGYVSLGSSGAYNLVTIPEATLLSDGVRVGDLFRSNFAVTTSGEEVYEEYEITNIIDEQNLELQTPAFADVVGDSDSFKMVQIVRSLNRDEQAIAIAANSAELGSRRVVNIWPDYAYDNNQRVEGYFIAAAVAGLKASVAPHQPLTNVTLNGFTDITRSSGYFTPTQLNKIANGGTWIITKVATQDTTASVNAGSIITRHQLTTDYTDDNMAEVSITTNLDSISKWLRDDLRVIIGQYNNHPYMIQLIRTRLEYRLTYLQGNAKTQKAGPQLISYKINTVEVDKLIRTKVNADVDLTLPYPINNINLKLTVV
jgi:hypothetical protein